MTARIHPLAWFVGVATLALPIPVTLYAAPRLPPPLAAMVGSGAVTLFQATLFWAIVFAFLVIKGVLIGRTVRVRSALTPLGTTLSFPTNPRLEIFWTLLPALAMSALLSWAWYAILTDSTPCISEALQRTCRTQATVSLSLNQLLTLATSGVILVVGGAMLRPLRRSLVRVPKPRIEGPAVVPTPRTPSLIADYISLTKPTVVMLLLVTTLATMFITPTATPSLGLIFWTLLGGYLAAGGAGAINCAVEGDVDRNMGRTSRRPVPAGRIPAHHALIFGLTLCLLSFGLLARFVNLLTAGLALVGAIYYALAYTRWLKRSTWHNIIIGGGAGSMPPLVGWAAATGTINLTALVLFAIIFYWTPPHFWALALIRQRDYARAGVPMLPVVAGEAETRRQIWLYTLLMVAVSLLLIPLGAMGNLYLVGALLLAVPFLRSAWLVREGGQHAAIWGLYKYSLLYLALLFILMVVDRSI